MSDELNTEEQENYIEEMEQRYSGMMDNLENCQELRENFHETLISHLE